MAAALWRVPRSAYCRCDSVWRQRTAADRRRLERRRKGWNRSVQFGDRDLDAPRNSIGNGAELLAIRAARQDCYETTLSNAVEQIDRPTLTALHTDYVRNLG